MNLRAYLGSRVLGQDYLLDDLCPFLAGRMAEGPPAGRPLASLLFIGPHRTGMTLLAQSLADFLSDNPKTCLRYDAAELDSVFRLVGVPPPYFGWERGGGLTRPLIDNPRRVIMFEHFQRCNAQLRDLLVRVVATGRLKDESSGQMADFSQALVILHSCAESQSYEKLAIADDAEYARTVREIWSRNRHDPEESFRLDMARVVDKVCVFRPLDTMALVEIAGRSLQTIAAEFGVELGWVDPRVFTLVAGKYSVREMERELADLLGDRFAAAIESGFRRVRIDLEEGELEMSPF